MYDMSAKHGDEMTNREFWSILWGILADIVRWHIEDLQDRWYYFKRPAAYAEALSARPYPGTEMWWIQNRWRKFYLPFLDWW